MTVMACMTAASPRADGVEKPCHPLLCASRSVTIADHTIHARQSTLLITVEERIEFPDGFALHRPETRAMPTRMTKDATARYGNAIVRRAMAILTS